MALILALFLFGIAVVLFGLAIVGAILTAALAILAGVLSLSIKLLERRAAAPEILIIIEDAERPVMRDVTPRKSTRRLMAPGD